MQNIDDLDDIFQTLPESKTSQRTRGPRKVYNEDKEDEATKHLRELRIKNRMEELSFTHTQIIMVTDPEMTIRVNGKLIVFVEHFAIIPPEARKRE